jgi:hypothetical protein
MKMSMREEALGKFVSLILEGIKGRLKVIENRIREALRK